MVQQANEEQLIRNDDAMQYRQLGRTGLSVSALSFGCMRLGEDRELNTELVSAAVDAGVNYFETTRGYCGGQCQHRTAPGLKGKTKGVIVSGKAGVGPDTTAHSFLHEVERQLDILGVTHFKFFQVGWLSWENVKHLLKAGGALEGIREAQRSGLIHHIGFTGHDTPENFITCCETGLFDSITVQYNMFNRRYERCIARAAELGMGVVAMSPVAGGALALHSDALKESFELDLSTPAISLRFVLSNPHISTACSGMSTLEQLRENVETAGSFQQGGKDEFGDMCARLDRLMEKLGGSLCTACHYCMPCPQDVMIPRYMEIYRTLRFFDSD